MPRSAVFLDRDGVINALRWDGDTESNESPYRPSDVELEPGAIEGLSLLRAAGFALIVVSNQAGAAKGRTTLEALRATHERVRALLEEADADVDDYRYCHHHPEGVVAELAIPCGCRKPGPDMILEAARDHGIDLPSSWLVGDADRDIEAGRRAGCRTVLVENAASRHRRPGAVEPDERAGDLHDAARLIMAAGGTSQSRPNR